METLSIPIHRLDIEVYNYDKKDNWVQGKYLVHSHDDVLLTNSIDDAIGFLKQSLEELEKDESSTKGSI